MSDFEEVQKLVTYSEDQLFRQAMREIAPAKLQLSAMDALAVAQAVQRWYHRGIEEMRAALCGSATVTAYLADPEAWNSTLLCAALCDIVPAKKLGIQPATLSVLAVRFGLVKLCSSSPDELGN